MSGLINSSFQQDRNFTEGIVTSVDPIRFSCHVKTISGKMFSDVTWLLPTGGNKTSGLHLGPKIGDKVLVMTGLTFPLIIGSMARIGPSDEFATPVGTSVLNFDAGSSMSLKSGFTGSPGKPTDFVVGDVITTNDNGGAVGLLSLGTAILRASRLAQVICSKMDDLVRVVARNYERIHDWGEETVANLYGRLYRYIGFNRDFDKSKLGIYEYEVFEGDVAAAEYGKSSPFGKENVIPARSTVVRKKVLHNSVGGDFFVETLEDEGKMTVTVTGSKVSRVYQDNGLLQETITGPHISESFQDDSTIRHSVDSISKITITPTNIVVDFNGEATATFDATGINMQAKGHFAIIDSSGVHLG